MMNPATHWWQDDFASWSQDGHLNSKPQDLTWSALRQEWDGGFSLHMCLIREENISQKTHSPLPLRGYWQDWLTFPCLALWKAERVASSTVGLWGERKALPIRKKDGEWLLGRQTQLSATGIKIGSEYHLLYGDSLRDSWDVRSFLFLHWMARLGFFQLS